MIAHSNQILILLLVFSRIMSSALFGQTDLEDDPFGDTEETSLLPRKASFLEVKEAIETVGTEVMFKHMPLLYERFENLALTRRDLRSVSNIRENDEVYEMSHLFPNCEGRDDLWVVYNATSSKLIANVDSLLRSSVNDYVYRVGKRMVKRLKFSLTYIEVDRGVPLDIDSLNKASYKLLVKQAGVIRVNEGLLLDISKLELKFRKFADDRCYIDLLLKLDNENRLEVKTASRIGEYLIQELGVTEGDKKRVLITLMDLDDLTGRLESDVLKKLKLTKQGEKQAGVEEIPALNIPVSELKTLMGGYKGNSLKAPPAWLRGSENDVVYDLTDDFERAGVRFGEDEWTIVNYTTERMYIKATSNVRKQFSEVIDDILTNYPLRVHSVLTFYEVDAVVINSDRWDVQTVLSAKPILLGRVGISLRSGERTTVTSKLGFMVAEIINGEDGLHADHYFNIDLKLKNRTVRFEGEEYLKRNVLSFIDLGTGSVPSKKIIMMVDSVDERLKYKRAH